MTLSSRLEDVGAALLITSSGLAAASREAAAAAPRPPRALLAGPASGDEVGPHKLLLRPPHLRTRSPLSASLRARPRQPPPPATVQTQGWPAGAALAESLLAQAQLALEAAAGAAAETVRQDWSDRELVSLLWRVEPPVPVEASHPLFILYTSGSTGKPKGIVHSHAGFQLGLCATSAIALDLPAAPPRAPAPEAPPRAAPAASPPIAGFATASESPDAAASTAAAARAAPPSTGDVLLVIATPGWITGQAYMISAALLSRTPSVLLDGSPVSPPDRFAAVIARHRVSVLKVRTAPPFSDLAPPSPPVPLCESGNQCPTYVVSPPACRVSTRLPVTLRTRPAPLSSG